MDEDDLKLEDLDAGDLDLNMRLDGGEKDCLDKVPITGDVETDAKAEVKAVLAAFKARAKREQERRQEAVDSEYWFCVCFQTRGQKEAFLKAMGWFEHGDKYLDGRFVARRLKVDLPEAALTFQGEKELKSFTKVLKPIVKIRKRGESK